jgi:GGDEF domain-containing protein
VEQLHSAATTDELTGLYNRRALEERLAAEISAASGTSSTPACC